jgi:hypothetical protein
MKENAALGQAKAARKNLCDTAISTSTAIISSSVPNAQAPGTVPDPFEVFCERCDARAVLFFNGHMSMHEAVDELQAAAERTGLVDRIGQDHVQQIMGAAFAAPRADVSHDTTALEPEPRKPVVPQRSYRTPASTIAAFWFLVGCNDPGRLKAWLRQRPADAPNLLKLLEGK